MKVPAATRAPRGPRHFASSTGEGTDVRSMDAIKLPVAREVGSVVSTGVGVDVRSQDVHGALVEVRGTVSLTEVERDVFIRGVRRVLKETPKNVCAMAVAMEVGKR